MSRTGEWVLDEQQNIDDTDYFISSEEEEFLTTQKRQEEAEQSERVETPFIPHDSPDRI